MILVDTNLLLRASQPGDKQHQTAVDAIVKVGELGYEPCIVPQVLYEYWVVVTRPLRNNGFGMSADNAKEEIDRFLNRFHYVSDHPDLFNEWFRLVVEYNVQGKVEHDARLVAAMILGNVTHMLTFNYDDFQRFAEITIVAPDAVDELTPLT
jgi:predicted nucleic acid-binding protein